MSDIDKAEQDVLDTLARMDARLGPERKVIDLPAAPCIDCKEMMPPVRVLSIVRCDCCADKLVAQNRAAREQVKQERAKRMLLPLIAACLLGGLLGWMLVEHVLPNFQWFR